MQTYENAQKMVQNNTYRKYHEFSVKNTAILFIVLCDLTNFTLYERSKTKAIGLYKLDESSKRCREENLQFDLRLTNTLSLRAANARINEIFEI